MCYDIYFLKLSPDYFDRIIKYGMDTKKKDNQTDEQRQNIIFSYLRYGEHMTTAPPPPHHTHTQTKKKKKKTKKKKKNEKKKKTSISDTVIKRIEAPETY